MDDLRYYSGISLYREYVAKSRDHDCAVVFVEHLNVLLNHVEDLEGVYVGVHECQHTECSDDIDLVGFFQ